MTDKATGRKDGDPPKTGHNGWPLQGTIAHVHAAAHIAENCPFVAEPQDELRRAIAEMRFHASRVRKLIESIHETKAGDA